MKKKRATWRYITPHNGCAAQPSSPPRKDSPSQNPVPNEIHLPRHFILHHFTSAPLPSFQCVQFGIISVSSRVCVCGHVIYISQDFTLSRAVFCSFSAASSPFSFSLPLLTR